MRTRGRIPLTVCIWTIMEDMCFLRWRGYIMASDGRALRLWDILYLDRRKTMGRIYKPDDPQTVAPLFAGWQETMIESCLQGIMGEIYVSEPMSQERHPDNSQAGDSVSASGACPRSAMAMLGDFCFLAGEPDGELAAFQPEDRDRDFRIMVPRDSFPDLPMEPMNPLETAGRTWEDTIRRIYGGKVRKVTRYAIKKEPEVWDLGRLRAAVEALSPEYELRLIDKELYLQCKENEWSRDLVAQFGDYEQYQKWGLGAVILRGREIVSGASSYSAYRGGIEIEIDTREDHRRKGLAYVCGARLILECCARKLYPSWDAQNLWSVALAEKLGYHFDHAYSAYCIYAKKD